MSTRPCIRCDTPHSRHYRAVYCDACLILTRRERNKHATLNKYLRDRCTDCGRDRGEDGTSIRCRPCADTRAARERNSQRAKAVFERVPA
jgi:hypothetical protein